ncbi:serine/threonine-protein kinase MARK2-like [Dugong dugon]
MLQSHLAFSAEEETHVGHYHLLRTISKGTFARVKLAQHIITGKEVAIKIVDKIQQSSYLNRLYREIKIMKNLHHPNVVKLFQVIESEDTVYIVMEYASGGDLFDHLLAHGLMNEEEARMKFHQIVSAVQYCHNKSIVHRDLKTENLLLDDRMNIKLADFGLGTEFTVGKKLDTFCGTLPYCAPELFQGENYDGPPVDVWSLGVILYFMVSGSLPFGGKTLMELREQVLEGQYDIPFHMSTECEHLLSEIFICDPRKRATLQDILGHLWMKVDREEKQTLYVQPLPDYDDPWRIEAMVKMGYTQEEIRDSLMNQKYDDVMATYLLLAHTSEMESHISTLEPQTAAYCNNIHTPSSSHEVHPTICAKPKQGTYTKPAIPTYDDYIHNTSSSLSDGRMGTSMVSASSSVSLSLSHQHQESRTAWAQPSTAPHCVSVASSSAHTISNTGTAPEGMTSPQGVSELSPFNDEQVLEIHDEASLPQTVTPASPSVSSQGQQGATGRFFKLLRRYLCFMCIRRDPKVSDSKVLEGMLKLPEAKPRSLKFTWRMKITSSMEPNKMMQKICQVLDANGCEWDLTHKYTLLCMNGTPGQEDFVQWRMEVCTLPRRTLNGVKVKKISGTSEAFSSIASKITRELVL